MLYINLAVLLSAVTFFYWYQYHRKFRKLETLPGPPRRFLIGNALDFGDNIVDSFNTLIGLPAKYGPRIRLFLGPFRRSVILTAPKDVEFFLSSNEHIHKSPGYDGLKFWLGNGLIHSSSDHWRKHRRIITPTFHFKILEQFTEFINSNCQHLIEKLKTQVGENYDIYPLINLYALDVICETAMNIKINAMDNGNREYVDAVKGYLEIFIIRFFSLFKQSDFLFKFTPEYAKMKKCVKILKSFTENVVQKRMIERRNRQEALPECSSGDENFGIKKKTAFLDLLLDLGDGNDKLRDVEIREEVDTFMFAGHDTVSSTIAFALFEIAKSADIQQRMFDESVEIVGSDPAQEFTFRDIQDMKYLDMVVKESMRMNATVPFIERQIKRDVFHDGVTYPENTVITIVPYAMHHNPELYPNPGKFDPDRFLPEAIAKRHPFAYLPFSAGPRNCIGQRFAMLETKATLIKIVRNFILVPVQPEVELIKGNDGVIKSLNGVPIVLKTR